MLRIKHCCSTMNSGDVERDLVMEYLDYLGQLTPSTVRRWEARKSVRLLRFCFRLSRNSSKPTMRLYRVVLTIVLPLLFI